MIFITTTRTGYQYSECQGKSSQYLLSHRGKKRLVKVLSSLQCTYWWGDSLWGWNGTTFLCMGDFHLLVSFANLI